MVNHYGKLHEKYEREQLKASDRKRDKYNTCMVETTIIIVSARK